MSKEFMTYGLYFGDVFFMTFLGGYMGMLKACKRTYQFGKQFDDLLHDYNFPCNPPILNFHAGLHFLNNVSLLWLVTKDKEKTFKIDKILRWLHCISDYT